MALERLSFSLATSLRERLDDLVRRAKYTNRSEFIRDLVRKELVRTAWEAGRETLGTLTLVYDHHQRELGRKLTSLQHEHYGKVLAALHIHLDRHHCAEVLLVRGKGTEVRELSDRLRQLKGVLHAELSMSNLGAELT